MVDGNLITISEPRACPALVSVREGQISLSPPCALARGRPPSVSLHQGRTPPTSSRTRGNTVYNSNILSTMLIKTSYRDVETKADGCPGKMRIFVIEPNVPEYPEAKFPGCECAFLT